MGPRQVLMTRIVWATVVPQKSRQSEAILPFKGYRGANHKNRLKTDCCLKLGSMKEEFRVIVD